VVAGGFPLVFPVNYTVARVLIRTDPGTKRSHAQFERVSFEVDDLDRSTRSVLVKGVVHELQRGNHLDHELQQAAERIASWAGGDRAHVLVITPVNLTGRRVGAP
jgi:Pyridoxamine 5'-phosphate oxidase